MSKFQMALNSYSLWLALAIKARDNARITVTPEFKRSWRYDMRVCATYVKIWRKELRQICGA